MTLCFKQIKVKESTLEKHLGLLWSQMMGLFFTCDGARAEDSGFGFGERENVLNLEKER